MVNIKRKSSDGAVPGPKSKKRKDSGKRKSDVIHDTSVFGELVKKAGVLLKSGNSPNEISTDQAIFQRDLGLALKRHADFPQVVDDFVTHLQNHLEENNRFRWCLMPTVTSDDSDEIARGGNQDSLMRMLMCVDHLQPLIMNMLLEKLAEFTGDEDDIFAHGERINLPRLIMNQFRWLDHIVDSKKLCQKMLEMVTITSFETQREIITCIPEVIDDAEHEDVASQLRELLTENNELTVPILDALSNLNLKPDLLSQVRGSVIQSLPSVGIDDLPVVVKFLLQSTSDQDSFEVICEVRNNLDFEASFPPAESSTPYDNRRSSMRNQGTSGSEALTLDAIKSAVRFQKKVADAWIKAIDNVNNANSHKVLDIFVLIILHAANRKKAVESLFRNKIRNGHFTEVLLQAAFCSHSGILREYFPSILSLGEVLLRSPEPAVNHAACSIYRHAFLSFDMYCQQEIVGNLVTHIGSGFAGEIDSSLDVLVDLVESSPSKMAPFAIFVKGVLDYLDNLSMTQIRKLYSMLSTLAFQNNNESALIQDDMHIIIRKQLSSSDPKYKRMGVIGAIMVVKSLAFNNDVVPSQSGLSNLESSMSDDLFKQVISLLQLVRSSSGKMAEAAALFMDELSYVVQKGLLDSKVEAWISENVINDFQDDFVIDVGPDSRCDVLPMVLNFGLDDEGEGAIAINLLPLLVAFSKKLLPGQKEKKVIAPVCLSPHFRLLQICEQRQHEGDLEGIDALLGCPIYLPDITLLEKLGSMSQKEKELICDSLFFTINWLRELLNAFASQKEAEMKGKVISRLQNVTQLHKYLEKSLSATPNYIPPAANFDWEDNGNMPNVGASTTAGGKKPKKTSKKSKSTEKDNDSDESRDETMMDKDTQDNTKDFKDKENEADKADVNLSSYVHFFRELDMNVFTVLNTGLIMEAALDTEMNTKTVNTLEIKPPQLEFLMTDLCRKLEHALIASKRRTFLKASISKRRGFSNLDQFSSREIAKKTVKLLPAMCSHLESTSGFFQALIAANDGVVDGPGSDTEEAAIVASCFQLLLQAFGYLFSWSGFLLSDNRELLKEALAVLVSRMASQSTTQVSFQDLLRQSFHYLENFSGTVPNLQTAVQLVRLLMALSDRDQNESNLLQKKIGALSQTFLKREWLGADGKPGKGVKHNECLQLLVRTFINCSEDSLSSMENLAAVGVPELLDAEKNEASTTYPSLSRSSFGVFYRVILVELVGEVKTIIPSKNSDTTEMKLEKLIRWNLAVRIFHILANLIKAFDGRSNLGSILKYGRQFLDIFLRQGMPLLDSMFRSHKDDVQGLLKNLQLTTRALHHMCGHSKIIKDVSLTNQVPLVKRCLETFVYRVKAMLTMNSCLEAFWMGNLKNRDLQGEEILSQVSRVDSTEGDQSDSDAESLPGDDDSEVEMDSESVASNENENQDYQESYSESY